MPQWISRKIEYRMHKNDVFLYTVVNGEREALGEAPVMTIYGLMDSTLYEKRINI